MNMVPKQFLKLHAVVVDSVRHRGSQMIAAILDEDTKKLMSKIFRVYFLFSFTIVYKSQPIKKSRNLLFY